MIKFGVSKSILELIYKTSTSISLSKIKAKTGQKVNIVAYPNCKYELNTGIDT